MRFLIILLLAGCASGPTTVLAPVSIVWHRTNRPDIDCELVAKRETGKSHTGCAVKRGDICHVFAPDPPMVEGKYVFGQWGTLGHEIKHCFDGKFHN
jgi:hypothetical protein